MPRVQPIDPAHASGKAKEIFDGPLKGKSHAELCDVVDAVTPALSKHGLSSSWKITKDEPAWMEVTCYLRHVGGHQAKAAELLGISRTTFRARLQQLNVAVEKIVRSSSNP